MFKKLADALPQFSGTQGHKNGRGQRQHYRRRDTDDLFDFLELIERWENIVGPKLSKVTVPLKNQGTTLTILTNHSAYSQALSYMEETLRSKLYAEFPSLEGKVKKLNFIVSTTHFDQQKRDLERRINKEKKVEVQKKKQKELHPHNPLYKKIKALAEVEFQSIEDPELKEQMISLYIQNEIKKL